MMDKAQNNDHKNKINCPECDMPIYIAGDLKMGKTVECRACGIESEVIKTNPLSLAPLEEEK